MDPSSGIGVEFIHNSSSPTFASSEPLDSLLTLYQGSSEICFIKWML